MGMTHRRIAVVADYTLTWFELVTWRSIIHHDIGLFGCWVDLGGTRSKNNLFTNTDCTGSDRGKLNSAATAIPPDALRVCNLYIIQMPTNAMTSD